MTGTCDNIQPTMFRYGRYIYITWDYAALTDGGYSFQYIELPADSSLSDVLAALIEAGVKEDQMVEIMASVEADYNA